MRNIAPGNWKVERNEPARIVLRNEDNARGVILTGRDATDFRAQVEEFSRGEVFEFEDELVVGEVAFA